MGGGGVQLTTRSFAANTLKIPASSKIAYLLSPWEWEIVQCFQLSQATFFIARVRHTPKFMYSLVSYVHASTIRQYQQIDSERPSSTLSPLKLIQKQPFFVTSQAGQGETAEMAETAKLTALFAIIVLSMLRMIAHGSFTLS